MNKSELLKTINTARYNHETWLVKLEPIIKGLSNFNTFPLTKTKSTFGEWLYNDALLVKNTAAYQELDTIYSNIYKALLNLIKIIANPTEKTLFNGSKRKREKELTTVYFDQINNLSFDLFKALYKLEKDLEEELKNTVSNTRKAIEPATNSRIKKVEKLENNQKNMVDATGKIFKLATNSIRKTVVNLDVNHNAAMRMIQKEPINPNIPTEKTERLKNNQKKGKKKCTSSEKKDIEYDIKRILGG